MTRFMTGIAELVPSRGEGSRMLALLAMTASVFGTGCVTAAAAGATKPTTTAARTAPLSPEATIILGNAIAAAQAPTYVVFVGRKPAHCDGALCWEIVNNHDNPVALTINGQRAQVIGPLGPLLPSQSRGYVRLVYPGTMEIEYQLLDSIRLLDNGVEFPRAVTLARCRVTANVGGSVDAHWGGHVTRLSSSFCRG